MRLLRGLAAFGLLVGLMSVSSSAAAQVNPSRLDDAPILVVVTGSELISAPTDEGQNVSGQSWAVGDEVDLFVNGAHVATAIAEPNAEGTATPYFDVNALGVIIAPGDEVKLVRIDGGRTEVHIVTSLGVSRIDVATETVAGTAEPGSEVVVFNPNTTTFRAETADAQGDWTADFSVPGDQLGEETTLDLENLTLLGAAQFDADGNATLWVTAPAAYAPIIAIVDGAELLGAATGQFVSGQSWAVGDEVDLLINGDFVATSIAEQNAEGSASPFFDVNTLGVTLQAGDEVKLVRTDGGRTEMHTVTDLSVTLVDVQADTVSGTSAPGSEVVLVEKGAIRSVTANEAGTWMADFSQPVDQPFGGFAIDLVPESAGQATQFDDAGNQTTALWPAPTSSTCTIDGTEGNDWLFGTHGDDVICGFGGNDRLFGFGGNDILLGGEGKDTLLGGFADDVILGGDGNDRLFGGVGDDQLSGEGGRDRLYGGFGDDVILGGDGNDTLWGHFGDDSLDGGADTDRCVPGRGSDTTTDCER